MKTKTRRGLLVSGIVIALVAIEAPAFAKGDTTFVVSGGNLRGSVSIDTSQFTSVPGQWWSLAAQAPSLTGPRYRLRLYDDWSHAFMEEWVYIPGASGALPVRRVGYGHPLTNDGREIKWIAFSPAFNSAFLNAIKSGGDAPWSLIAYGTVILFLMVALGLSRRSAKPLPLRRLRAAPAA